MKDWSLYAWVVRGKQRKAIIQVMNKPKIPSEIHKEAKQYNEKISLNNTSDVLKEFRKKTIAECINEKQRVGRLYKLTKKGEEIRQQIIKI